MVQSCLGHIISGINIVTRRLGSNIYFASSISLTAKDHAFERSFSVNQITQLVNKKLAKILQPDYTSLHKLIKDLVMVKSTLFVRILKSADLISTGPYEVVGIHTGSRVPWSRNVRARPVFAHGSSLGAQSELVCFPGTRRLSCTEATPRTCLG